MKSKCQKPQWLDGETVRGWMDALEWSGGEGGEMGYWDAYLHVNGESGLLLLLQGRERARGLWELYNTPIPQPECMQHLRHFVDLKCYFVPTSTFFIISYQGSFKLFIWVLKIYGMLTTDGRPLTRIYTMSTIKLDTFWCSAESKLVGDRSSNFHQL